MALRIWGLLLCAALLAACGDNEAADDLYKDDPNDPVICVGDPDTGVVCKKQSDFWDCTSMPNGDVKCVQKQPQNPGGSATWKCTQQGTKIVCTTTTPNVQGGSGWKCVSTAAGTTCEKEGPVPGGGGTWNCVLTEFVWTCTRKGGGTTVPPGTTPPPGSIPPGAGTTVCLFPPAGTTTPGATPTGAWATVIAKKVTYNGKTALYARVTFNKLFVDNTYGVNSTPYYNKPGKQLQHTFQMLEESDKSEIYFHDAKGNLVLHAAVDYISASSTAWSGYACLGVTGGEGMMIKGSASSVLGARSSLHVNLNEYKYKLLVDSPKTDANYTPNPLYPNWIFDVWYEVWVDWAVFGSAGAGKVYITGIHASPSRVGANSFDVNPGACP